MLPAQSVVSVDLETIEIKTSNLPIRDLTSIQLKADVTCIGGEAYSFLSQDLALLNTTDTQRRQDKKDEDISYNELLFRNKQYSRFLSNLFKVINII